jgi:fimbrial chaperone protein
MRRIPVLALLFCLLPGPAFALKISPFKTTLDAGASLPAQVFRIENNSAEPAAIQISVMTWDIAPDGTETNADAEKDFAVFPSQVVLPPHENRAVRVQWLGAFPGGAEKPYRLVAEQLPVNLSGTPGGGSAVRFLLRFKAALYVAAGAVKSDISVAEVKDEGGGKIGLTVVNKGTGHDLLHNPSLRLRLADGSEEKIAGEALKPLESENLHPGRTRRFEIFLPRPPASRIVSAALDFESSF